jgi:hypothetical protein
MVIWFHTPYTPDTATLPQADMLNRKCICSHMIVRTGDNEDQEPARKSSTCNINVFIKPATTVSSL